MLKHPATQSSIEYYCNNPSHALLLIGAMGSGKNSIAREIAGNVLGAKSLDIYPYYLEISADKISIESIRSVKSFLSKTTTGSKIIRRIVLINSVDSLNESGQNALLKSIEEPPADSIILMTASDQTLILPTILSRSRILQILPLQLDDVVTHYRTSYSDAEIKRAFAVSNGNARILEHVLHDKHNQEVLELAKTILKADTYQRLVLVDEIIKSKTSITEVIAAMEIAIRMNFETSIASSQEAVTMKLHQARQQLLLAQKHLAAKTNSKLVLSRLFLSI